MLAASDGPRMSMASTGASQVSLDERPPELRDRLRLRLALRRVTVPVRSTRSVTPPTKSKSTPRLV